MHRKAISPASADLRPDAIIRSEPFPFCTLCGSEGTFVYRDQEDRMFGAAGKWNLKKCTNEQCTLYWLDPMPVADDVGKAYVRYYTHQAANHAVQQGLLRRILARMKREYLADKYGYKLDSASFVRPRFGRWLYLLPLRRAEADGAVRFLSAKVSGRLLDVGCGSGDWLLSMREFGWDVSGVEFDESAAIVGRRRGLAVHSGALEHQHFANDSFDAITLNHVIEHVTDPVGTLRECVRILKPGGTLVMFTPNTSSLGHRIYGSSWRGLEPPRHLHLFSFHSMQRALELAGFRRYTVLPWVAESMIYESHYFRLGQYEALTRPDSSRWVARLFTRCFSWGETALICWKPWIADCVAAIAMK